MHLISHYSADDSTREKLYPLFDKVFGIETGILKDFHARGFWNRAYTPYTFFNGDEAVANVSMFAMPLLIEGKRIKGAGIQSVMTDPDYRGRGLMKQLFQLMLTDLDKQSEVSFLFTDKPDLYTPFGFRILQEHYFTGAFSSDAEKKGDPFRKLIFFNRDDAEILRDLFQTRVPLSHQFFPLSYESSFYLNMYNPHFGEKLYYSKELETVIVAEINGDALRLYDIIGRKRPELNKIANRIMEPFSRVELYFQPDLLGCHDIEAKAFSSGNKLMVRGNFSLETTGNSIKFPLTAEF